MGLSWALQPRLSKDAEFEQEVKNNPEQNVWWAFEKKFNGELQGLLEEHSDFYKKLNNNPEIKAAMMKEMFKTAYSKMQTAI